jgi:hypothetical protein
MEEGVCSQILSSGRPAGALSWLLLGAGSVASLAANVAVAEPTMTGRVIAAWPSFALIGSYELLMRQIRATAAALSPRRPRLQPPRTRTETSTLAAGASVAGTIGRTSQRAAGNGMRQQALEWALANRGEDGKLPSGKTIAGQFGRHARWGRLVKQHVATHMRAQNTEEAAA